jgi:hypothetical protein
MHLGLKNWPFVPHNLIPVQMSPVPVLKFQMAPIVVDSVNSAHFFRRTALHIFKECELLLLEVLLSPPLEAWIPRQLRTHSYGRCEHSLTNLNDCVNNPFPCCRLISVRVRFSLSWNDVFHQIKLIRGYACF